jgi:hypothetical protein
VRVPPCRRRELLRAAPHRRHELLCAAPRPSRAPPRGAPHRRRGRHGQATRAAHRRGSLEPLVHGELLRPDVGVALDEEWSSRWRGRDLNQAPLCCSSPKKGIDASFRWR